MKKTYNSPATMVVKIAHHHMIAESIQINGNYDGKADIEVKEDRTSRYNVWDDDWSN